MKRYLINIAFFACVAVAIYIIRISVVERFTDNQLKRVEKMQVRLED